MQHYPFFSSNCDGVRNINGNQDIRSKLYFNSNTLFMQRLFREVVDCRQFPCYESNYNRFVVYLNFFLSKKWPDNLHCFSWSCLSTSSFMSITCWNFRNHNLRDLMFSRLDLDLVVTNTHSEHFDRFHLYLGSKYGCVDPKIKPSLFQLLHLYHTTIFGDLENCSK